MPYKNPVDNVRWAYTSERYYRSEQFPTRTARRERNRIRLIANFIRRDVDLIAAEILDGKPVVNPQGRHPKHYELGRQLVQLIEWSRDEEENWFADLERAITGCIHVGEAALFEGWDQDADGGAGRPVAFAVDARFLLWDDTAEDLQRTDAEWIVWLAYEMVERIEAQWSDLEGQVQGEAAETYLVPAAVERVPPRGGPLSSGVPAPLKEQPRAWVKRQWSKEHHWETYYQYKDSGERVRVVDGDGEEQDLDKALYRLLEPDQKEQVLPRRRRIEELWETVVVNDTVVEHHLSPFDRSNGGHGHYPFCFFSYEVLTDEPRARGEISFLKATQDIRNEVISQVLEQMFLNNVGYWSVFRGSMTPDEREKLTRIFESPHQVVESIQGTPRPEHVGVDGRGLQAAASLVPLFKSLADDTSGVHEVDRGAVPPQIQSGRAIRALQAKTSRLNLKIKRHIEAGLRRATVLRLHNLMHFLRGPRIVDILDPKTQEATPLYLGHSEQEITTYYQLRPGQDEEGNPTWTNPEGNPAKILVLNDQVAEEAVFERVRLTLDTGQEFNKLERLEQAEMVLNIVGPAGLEWAAEQLDWANRDTLLEAVKQRDTALQQLAMGEQFQKETGISVEEALQMVRGGMAPQGPGMAPPGGAPGGAMPAPGGPVPPGGVPPVPPGPMPPGGPPAPPAHIGPVPTMAGEMPGAALPMRRRTPTPAGV